MRIAVNDTALECRIEGPPDRPWLVFSNSLMTNLTMWDAQAAALASDYQILRYDQRGHGGSDVPTEPFTIAGLTDDLVALMDAFDIERAFVVGSSMGGVTALSLACRRPHRALGLVVAGSQWAAPETAVTTWEDRIAMTAGGMEAIVEPTMARWFTPASIVAHGPALDRVRAMIRTTPREGFAACARALQRYDLRDEVAAIRVPTLFVVGESDAVLPVMRRMHEAVAGSQWASIAAAGHLPSIEQAETFTAAVTAFLQGAEGAIA